MNEEILDAWGGRLDAAGDVLTAVFAASYRRLVVQMYAVVGDFGEAEDVVQEAFVRASMRRRSLEAAANPEAWLRTVALNLYRNRWRKLRNFSRIRHRLVEPCDLPGIDEQHEELMSALRALPESQREVIALHHLVDLPVDEIAELLGCPTGTVKSRLARGRASLQATLGERGVQTDA